MKNNLKIEDIELIELASKKGNDADLLLLGKINETIDMTDKEIKDLHDRADILGDNITKIVDKVETIKFKKGDKGDPGYTPIKGKDYFDGNDADENKIIKKVLKEIPKPKNGKDADEEKIVEKVIKNIPIPENGKDADEELIVAKVEEDLPKLGEQIRDGLELLQEEDRLDKSAIKGLDNFDDLVKKAGTKAGWGAHPLRILDDGTVVDKIARTINFKGSAVDSVVRTNEGIIDVTLEGGDLAWGSITGTLSDQTDLQGELDDKLDVTTAASTYLKLDSSNDPLTGGLGITGGNLCVQSDNYTYVFSASPFKGPDGGSTNYSGSPTNPAVFFSIYKGATWYDTMIADSDADVTVSGLDETVGALDVYLIETGLRITIVTNESWANLKAHMDGSYGTSLVNESGVEGVGAYSFSSPSYTFNMPTGWSIADDRDGLSWANPPTVVATAGTSLDLNYATDELTLYGNLNNDNASADLDWEGIANFGSLAGAIPVADYVFQVGEAFGNTDPSKLAPGLNFFISSNPTALSGAYCGVYGGVQANGTITQSAYGVYTQIRAVTTGGVSGVGNYATIALPGGASPGTSSYKGYVCSIGDEGGSASTMASYQSFVGVSLGGKGSWSVTQNIGLYLYDNSSYATTSWGIYNLDRSYLNKDVYSNADSHIANLKITTTDNYITYEEDVICYEGDIVFYY